MARPVVHPQRPTPVRRAQMSPITHRAAAPRLAAAGGGALAALVLALSGAQAALAAGPAPFAGGLHVATGSIVDPTGRTWVSDHNAGFCRVSDPAQPLLGSIEHPQ